MRHIWTMIAAVVVAPLAWLLLAYGQDRSLQAFANEESAGAFATGDFVRPAVSLAAAGLLLGLLATLRFSPLGAVLTGLVYTGSYVALLVSPDGVVGAFPKSVSLAGHSVDPTTPLRTGGALMLGGLLLVGVASVGRWRRWPAPAAEDADLSTEPVTHPEDRPLGVDGLGLGANPARPEPTPVPPGGLARAFDRTGRP
ncbi:hypothetical protein [Micromonospora sp. WMMD812]|uniref:hypothetical protein n=1 Tax=Micromonospora sp. WMMD812 TaxID=3015152 RepID=UPI00248BF4BA|nr:hypothetical protein [Micromonospora sp. WMMD812]WBB68629.1 hypothetical protein O7603_04410 [Micromonospora sp. WMMD812]